ncbi:MAG: hypothetical protein M3299_02170 [Thermoproteota archaeon]|nr:hypothetical protein [Thermoproteota archaeon]
MQKKGPEDDASKTIISDSAFDAEPLQLVWDDERAAEFAASEKQKRKARSHSAVMHQGIPTSSKFVE